MASRVTHDRPIQPQVAEDPAAAAGLMARAQRGDRAAFGKIVRLYQDRLYTAVLRLVGNRDEAVEITQEAFTRALQSMDDFHGDSAPYTWLCRIATNLSLDRLRRQARRRTFSLDGLDGHAAPRDQASALLERVRQSEPGPAESLDRRERAEQVIAALGRVDPEFRAVLVLRDVDGLDYQQMAEVLGLPLGTLKSRLFRARVALREELQGYMS